MVPDLGKPLLEDVGRPQLEIAVEPERIVFLGDLPVITSTRCLLPAGLPMIPCPL